MVILTEMSGKRLGKSDDGKYLAVFCAISCFFYFLLYEVLRVSFFMPLFEVFIRFLTFFYVFHLVVPKVEEHG